MQNDPQSQFGATSANLTEANSWRLASVQGDEGSPIFEQLRGEGK